MNKQTRFIGLITFLVSQKCPNSALWLGPSTALVLILTSVAPALSSAQSLESAPQLENVRSEMQQSEKRPSADLILRDPLDRVTAEFQIPEGLRDRTQFWMEVYSRFDSYDHIIHHTRYPWIVFKVVNVRDMVENGKGARWLRLQKAENFVDQERKMIVKSLAKLARAVPKKPSPFETELLNVLQAVPGKRKQVLKMASMNVRKQLGQKDFFLNALRNSSKYLPYMEEEFQKLDLPLELTRIPFVESSFNELAQSRVGASGIWQIMPVTGKSYLTVNDKIDERNSPLKATRASGRLLRSYHRALKSWGLTITSYNHGIGNIQKAIKAAKSRDISEIIDRYHKGDFKFASSNFYTCFLAALYVERYHDLLFKDVSRDRLQIREIVSLPRAIKAKDLLKLTQLELEVFLDFNRDLKQAVLKNAKVPKGFELHLPPEAVPRVQDKIGTEAKTRQPRA